MNKVFLDSNIFIYFFEGRNEFVAKAEKLISGLESSGQESVTSVITLAETLVKPMRDGNLELVEKYKQVFLYFPGLKVEVIDEKAAIKASEFRAKYGFRLMDSLQLSTAIHNRCDIFWTNDKNKEKCREIKVMILA